MADPSPGDVARSISAFFAKLSNPSVVANLIAGDSREEDISDHHVSDTLHAASFGESRSRVHDSDVIWVASISDPSARVRVSEQIPRAGVINRVATHCDTREPDS